MKSKTTIKVKNTRNGKRTLNIIIIIVSVVLSLGLGFLIAYGGQGESYVETSLITAIITLFGFGLTSTVFVCQAFKDKDNEKIKRVIHALSNTLLLTLALIITSIILDFIGSLDFCETLLIIVKSLKYASLIYAFICQIDILLSFLIIVKNK